MQPIAAEIMPLQSNWRCRLCGLIKKMQIPCLFWAIFFISAAIPLSLICGMKGKDAWLFLDDNLSYLSPDDIQ